MFIKEKLSQYRRDFQAIYECEHCKCIQESYGYDDKNFHENVIPYMICNNCGEHSNGKITSEASVPAHVII